MMKYKSFQWKKIYYYPKELLKRLLVKLSKNKSYNKLNKSILLLKKWILKIQVIKIKNNQVKKKNTKEKMKKTRRLEKNF